MIWLLEQIDMKTILLLGNKITCITAAELNEEVSRIIRANQKELILHTNIHGINLALQEGWLREFRNSAHIVFSDGHGPVLGAALLGESIPGRIPITDWIWDFCSYCAVNNFSLFFLGTTQNIIEKARDVFLQKYPGLSIKGLHNGFFNKSGPENDAVIEQINRASPDVLIVAFGMPLQEKWLMENWNKLNAKVFLVGGACFDYASGSLKRGPKFLIDIKLEWLGRLVIEPKRLWKRYLIGNTVFFTKIIKELIQKRFK